MKETDLARVIAGSAEAKMLGVQERGLGALLKSRIVNIKPMLSEVKVEDQSIILPYIYRRQRSYINAHYFTITAGEVTPGAGTGGIPASAWNLTVDMGDSPWKTELESPERYFLPGNALYCLTWDDDSVKTSKTLMFTIVSSATAGANTATVTVQPNVTDVWWGTADSGEKLVYQPVFGVAQTGANSIHDYEEWCHNQPSDLSVKLLVNWVQHSRTSRCVTDSYKETLNLIMEGKVNPFAQSMVYQPLSAQNKQAAMLEDEAWLRSVWYNQQIDENQTPDTYSSLPVVYDPEDAGCPLAYKANALGVNQLLSECTRIIDQNGAVLDMDYIFEQLYYLKRHREADGDSIQVIDCMTDRWTANTILDVMSKYYKARYGWDTTRYAEIGKTIEHEGQVLFNYNRYDIPEVGIQLAVFHDPFFDDMVSAMPATVGSSVDFKPRGRQLWFLDWSDINIGIAGTNQVSRHSPDPDTNALYKCRMAANITEYQLKRQSWTVMLDRPQRHLMITNFSEACPNIAAVGCDVPNPA